MSCCRNGIDTQFVFLLIGPVVKGEAVMSLAKDTSIAALFLTKDSGFIFLNSSKVFY